MIKAKGLKISLKFFDFGLLVRKKLELTSALVPSEGEQQG
jgi:hypothetical protein